MPDTKPCRICGAKFPATPEYFATEKGKLRNECRNCKKKYNQEYHERNREKQNAKSRDYYAENTEYLRKYARTYYNEHHEEILEKARETYLVKRDRKLVYQLNYYHKNRDKELIRMRTRYQQNPESFRQSSRKIYRENKERYIFYSYRRRARVRQFPDNLTLEEWQAALNYWNNSCAYCGKPGEITADHYIPVSSPACPGTVASNIVPACWTCNCSKKHSEPNEWMKWKFGEDRAREIEARIQAYFASL